MSIVGLHARDTNTVSGARQCRVAMQALRKWVMQYRGPLNASVSTQNMLWESGPVERPVQASDASANWKYRYSLTYAVWATIAVPTGAT